jgi:PAS domain S-box-containing protein
MFNKAAAELAGISDPEEALGKTDYDFTTEEQADYFRKTDIEALKTGGVVEISEEILDNRAGRSIYLRSKKAPIYDQEGKAEYVLGITENITEEKRSRDVIEAALAEKEVLLREIHHRVKNNLAIISSLLNLQSAHSSNRPLNEVFEEIQVRIRSMASAHELLYKSQHLAYIDAADYVNNLVDHMFVSQAKLGTSIELIKEIDNITFGLDTAIPLGLLVTELVSNCLKHAFDPGQEGMAFIGLKRMDENLYELTVRDNGKGLPPDVDINNPESMGLDLVNAFTARLNGEIFIAKPQKGSEIRIVFTGFGK